MEYTIKKVSSKVDEWTNKAGVGMKTYYIMLSGVEGAVKLNQRATTPEPQENQSITGTISEDTYGKKFTKQSNYQPSSPVVDNEKREDSIYRCNALNNAVTYIAKAGTGLKDPSLEERVKVITSYADYFHQWLTNKEVVAETPPSTDSHPDEDINLDDIPF